MSLDTMSQKSLIWFFIILLKGLITITKFNIYTNINLK